MGKECYKIKFSSVIENICRVEEFIQRIFTQYSIGDVYQGRITTVIIEAVNNAILCGNISDPSKFVTVEFCSSEKYYEFTVSDEGDGFDYTIIPDPTLPENLEKESGRGLFLMTTLADEVIFKNLGATVVMRFSNNIMNLNR